MPRGTRFWGSNDQLNFLKKYLMEYTDISLIHPLNEEEKAGKMLDFQKFWSKVMKDFHNTFKTPENSKKIYNEVRIFNCL